MKHGAFIIGVSSCGEAVCAAAGRISTQKGTALEIMERSLDKDKNANLITKVTASGHTSTVEHVFFNLAFENVSVVVEQFMIEFRLASFTVKSRRYVDFADCGYLVPDALSESQKARYTAQMDKLFALYGTLCERGIPKEDARFVLPYCFYSNFFCSLGGRELINVLRAMLFGRGSKNAEIRAIGEDLLRQCKEKAPGVFDSFEEKNAGYRDLPELPLVKNDAKAEPLPAVMLLSQTPDAQKLVAKTALMERYGCTLEEADATVASEDALRQILDAVVGCDRPRALEAACFTVRFGDVSLSTLTHFARHRMQSIAIPSLTTCDRKNHIIPPCIEADAELLDLYLDAFASTAVLYDALKAEGVREDDLIYVLLSGNVIDFVTTLNARELRLFLKLRTCTRAQWEIRALATDLLFLLRKDNPLLFARFGPSCVIDGKCPEGRMCCGKQEEMRQKFLAD